MLRLEDVAFTIAADHKLIADRFYILKQYRRCAVASELTEWFVKRGYARGEADAVALGRSLVDAHWLLHVEGEHHFVHSPSLFLFVDTERLGDRGADVALLGSLSSRERKRRALIVAKQRKFLAALGDFDADVPGLMLSPVREVREGDSSDGDAHGDAASAATSAHGGADAPAPTECEKDRAPPTLASPLYAPLASVALHAGVKVRNVRFAAAGGDTASLILPEQLRQWQREIALSLIRWDPTGMGEPLCRRARAGSTATLGPLHVDTLRAAASLAQVLHDQNKLDEAESLLWDVLASREQVCGRRAVETIDSVEHLASLLHDRGKLKAASLQYRRALAGRTSLLGARHATTLTAANDLASLLHDQRDLDGAAALYRTALSGRDATLGAMDPDTIASVDNLADVLQDQGKLASAEPLLRRAWRGKRAVLGATHPATISSSYNLVDLLQQMRRKEDALALCESELALCREKLGASHVDTVDFTTLLAKLQWGRVRSWGSRSQDTAPPSKHAAGSAAKGHIDGQAPAPPVAEARSGEVTPDPTLARDRTDALSGATSAASTATSKRSALMEKNKKTNGKKTIGSIREVNADGATALAAADAADAEKTKGGAAEAEAAPLSVPPLSATPRLAPAPEAKCCCSVC